MNVTKSSFYYGIVETPEVRPVGSMYFSASPCTTCLLFLVANPSANRSIRLSRYFKIINSDVDTDDDEMGYLASTFLSHVGDERC